MSAPLLSGVLLLSAAFQATGAEPPSRGSAGAYLNRPAEWYSSDEAKQIAANVLSHQADSGGWPKNVSTTAEHYADDRKKLRATFDNGATTDELRLLARMLNTTDNEQYRTAFLKGLDHILQVQDLTGGWPQFSPPPRNSYHRHITFNDGAMVRLMRFVREVAAADRYGFVDAARRQAAERAFDRGVECILKCQIRVDGKLTAWCAQHDENDLSPQPGRTFELASISGAESVGIVELLMDIKDPGPQVIAAVEGAVRWFESAQLKGIRVQRVDVQQRKPDRVVIEDARAPPMWARFYEIGTNQPIFADRDGIAKERLGDLGFERRTGYSWLGYWPNGLPQKHAAWKRRLTTAETTTEKSKP